MIHSFNAQFAQKYGIEEAIIVHNFYFWLQKNAANDKHFFEGRVWTYNSNAAFAKLFPYINKTKIFRVLKNLDELGIIAKGNFNENLWDKTLWYSFTDNGIEELKIYGYDVTDFVKMNHRDLQNEPTIPYSNTNSKQDKEIEDKSSTKNDVDDFVERMYKMYPTKCPKRSASLGKSHKDKDRIKKLLKTYSMEDVEMVFNAEIEEKFEKQYMQNFSTFLNNFPDPSAIKEKEVKVDIAQGQDYSSEHIIIDGQLYR